MRILTIFVLSLSFISNTSGQTYIGDDFRFSFLANIDPFFNGTPNFDVSIEAIENATITVEYGLPANAYYQSQDITLAAGEIGVVSFNGVFLNQNTTNVIDNRSFHVTSTGDIRVYAFHLRAFFSEATPVLPTAELTSEYMVLSFSDPLGAAPSLYSVIATEDNTTINFLNTGSSPSGAAGDPFSLNLDAGEVITMASIDDLTGSTIAAEGDKPIAVFTGHRQARITAGCGSDSHMYEQLHPTAYWGTVHAIYPVTGNGGDFVRILSKEDGTEVFDGCDLIGTLAAGETLDGFYIDPRIIRSSAPVLIGMYTRGFECSGLNTGDPNMRLIQPLSVANTALQLQTNTGFIQNLLSAQTLFWLHLAMPSDQTDQIMVNGSPVLSWIPFPSLPSYSYVDVLVDDISITALQVESTVPFWSEYVALSGADAMTMSFGGTTTVEIPDDILIVNLGPDISICEGQSITLDPGLGIAGIWQDGSEQETFTVTEPGVYSVTITGGCSGGFNEVIVSPADDVLIDLPEAYELCTGGELEIGVPDQLGVDWLWASGETTSEISVSAPGVYSLVGSLDGSCQSEATTTVVAVDGPELTIDGPDELCEGNLALLTASGSGTFEWEDGTEGNVLEIEAPGTFTVTLNANGCSAIESIIVAPGQGPVLIISGPESLCAGAVGEISVDPIGESLVWEDGSEGTPRTVTGSGSYTATVLSEGCTSTATIAIAALASPILNASDLEYCLGDDARLFASSPNGTVSWPGFSESATLEIPNAGFFLAEAINECGSTSTTVEAIAIDCSCEAFVPNVFTPNGDGLNDLFFPEIECDPEDYSMLIFNRWGQLIFESTEPAIKWNGSAAREGSYFAPESVYQYLISFDNPLIPLSEKRVLRGSVTLLR